MSDPVAAKSGFLCMYMSNHPDTLVAYVKHFGNFKESIKSAQMTAIDSASMTLTYTKKGGDKGEIRLPISPPLSGYEEVKPRLLSMKAEAQEALGMIKAPQIDTFYFSPKAYQPAIALLLLGYCTLSAYQPSPLFDPARAITSAVGGFNTLKYIWYFVFVIHSLEAIYTYTLCRKHHTGFVVGAQYVLSTVVFGAPIWIELRKRIQAARIDSVMKVE